MIDKKLYPELQAAFLANLNSGECPCYSVGDELIFERNEKRDDFWHCGAGTLTKRGEDSRGEDSPSKDLSANPPDTRHCGEVPFCSEAWVSRYIYTALQGGSIKQKLCGAG